MSKTVRVQAPPSRDRDPGADLIRARDPVTIVIFGASGDLAHRKLLPALFHLNQSGYLPERYAILGISRTPMSDVAFREHMLEHFRESFPEAAQGVTCDHPVMGALHYLAGSATDDAFPGQLKARLEQLEKDRQLPGNRLFYLSVTPKLFAPIIEQLGAAGVLHRREDECWSRVIIEKPYGRDLESARALNKRVTAVLDESQIFRIDHFLGKETVQNILTFRFANAIFEPLYNQKYIDHVQITAAETLGMEGRRGAYYDQSGALRDMVQNHLMQLLCLLAMEPPCAMDARAIRDEKVKVLRSLAPFSCPTAAACTIRGQYGPGKIDGKAVKGYREEEGVARDSQTETYVALRLGIDNWRWAGVPFFLRTGKRLRRRVSEIAVHFKPAPLLLFRGVADQLGVPMPKPTPNQLMFRIQPDEGIRLSFGCKQPGLRMQLDQVEMDFAYGREFEQRMPEAYERLILDALRGDASLFTRSDEVDYAWSYIDQVLLGWQGEKPLDFPNYEPGSDGPADADRLLAGTEAKWRPLAEM